MFYKDPLYGYWELPDFIEELLHTKELVRLRKISQVCLPNSFTLRGPMPNRTQHGLGVCRLSMCVLENNPNLEKYKRVLPIAAILHDAGNSALSHLGEHFLREMTGKDGETFLEDILKGSETEKLLLEMKIDIDLVLKLITGRIKPMSDILNGSLDIDNLDNVGRYASAEKLDVSFDAMRIARSFKFIDNEWTLPSSLYCEAMKWKKAREAVYGNLYCDAELIPGTNI